MNIENKLIVDDLKTSMRTYSIGEGSNEESRRAILPFTSKDLTHSTDQIKTVKNMKNKFLIYTSNLDIMPKSMADVIEFAERRGKYMISNVELNPCLENVQEGDNIFSKKGNSIYVIRTFSESLEDMCQADKDYIDYLTRTGKLKKSNITGVREVVRFGTWCKSAKPLIKESSKEEKKEMKSNSIKTMAERIKSMFMPTKAEDVRISVMDNNICVRTADGYVAINEKNELISYPEELTLEFPVFVISKPKEQLAVGDVIALTKSYAKITKIEGEKISAISYTGAGKTIHTIKDFLFNQTMVRVVMSFSGMAGGQINPMLLMALSDGDKSDMLPLLLLSQNNGALGMNPMLAMMMAKGGDGDGFSMKDALMMSAVTGQNLFGGGLFGAPVAAPQAPAQAPVEPKAE